MRGKRLVQGRCNGEVVCRARTAAVCANGSINHHYSTEPPMDPLRETVSKRPAHFETNIIHIVSRPLPKILYEYEQNKLTGNEHRTNVSVLFLKILCKVQSVS